MNSHAKTHIVEAVIDVCQHDDTFTCTYSLRAFDAEGHVFHSAFETLPCPTAHTSDEARLALLIGVFKRLTVRLKDDCAPYLLRITQSSRNVDGWLSRSWNRKAPNVVAHMGEIDALRARFPEVETVLLPRERLAIHLSLADPLLKGGDARRA